MNQFSEREAFRNWSWLFVNAGCVSRSPEGGGVLTVSGESVLLVLRMISSSLCKIQRLLFKHCHGRTFVQHSVVFNVDIVKAQTVV